MTVQNRFISLATSAQLYLDCNGCPEPPDPELVERLRSAGKLLDDPESWELQAASEGLYLEQLHDLLEATFERLGAAPERVAFGQALTTLCEAAQPELLRPEDLS